MSESLEWKDVTRNINQDYLAELELVSNKVYPLPGATFERRGDPDPRLTQLKASNVGGNNKITFYEHLATVRHTKTGKYFVAFRQTKDAQLLEQNDPGKYPEWLMKDPVKRTELKIYIYMVKETSPGRPVIPSQMPNLATHEDWLVHIGSGPEWVFDTIAYFLLKNQVVSEEMYGSMR